MQCPGVAVCSQSILSESWIYKTCSKMREVTIMCIMCRSFRSIEFGFAGLEMHAEGPVCLIVANVVFCARGSDHCECACRYDTKTGALFLLPS
jgi:hypothetical protein